MFDDKGGMRIAAGKSALKNKLQLEMSTRFVPEPDITIIHGCAFLWIFYWPGNRTVKNFLAPAVTVGETEGAMDSTSVFFLPLLLPITL